MQIGAVSFRPYIYNTNMVSGSSLSKISAIGDDLLSGKTDFSGVAEEQENTNPLRRGETRNFMDVLDRQMRMGQLNASRLMRPAKEAQTTEQPAEEKAARAVVQTGAQKVISDNNSAAAAVEDFQPVSRVGETASQQSGRNLFMMQRAAEAYQMNMIA